MGHAPGRRSRRQPAREDPRHPPVGPFQPDGPLVVDVPGFTTEPVTLLPRQRVEPIEDGRDGQLEVCLPVSPEAA